MKRNDFENEYSQYAEYEDAFNKAEAAGDQEAMDEIQEAHKKLIASIADKGSDYCKTFNLYKKSVEVGNDCIDISCRLSEEQVEELVNSFRNCGIHRFTVSADRAAEMIWYFTKRECWMESEPVIVHTQAVVPFTRGKEHETAFAFAIKMR